MEKSLTKLKEENEAKDESLKKICEGAQSTSAIINGQKDTILQLKDSLKMDKQRIENLTQMLRSKEQQLKDSQQTSHDLEKSVFNDRDEKLETYQHKIHKLENKVVKLKEELEDQKLENACANNFLLPKCTRVKTLVNVNNYITGTPCLYYGRDGTIIGMRRDKFYAVRFDNGDWIWYPEDELIAANL